MLKGQELVWLEDPFEVYIAHVQGSAKIRLPDGQLITAGYAGNNGQEYQSVAKMLIDDGKIPSDRMSLAAMIDYFKTHPERSGQIRPAKSRGTCSSRSARARREAA